MLFGREGNQVLVNGRRLPELVVRAGAPQRWRVVNAAKSRYFKLDLGEGNVFRKIGGDGGLTEYFDDHDFIVLGAGERADALVTPTGGRAAKVWSARCCTTAATAASSAATSRACSRCPRGLLRAPRASFSGSGSGRFALGDSRQPAGTRVENDDYG